MSVCPYCDSDTWGNAWTAGNAQCKSCGQFFDVFWDCGHMYSSKVEQPPKLSDGQHLVLVDLPGQLKPRLIGKIIPEGQE